MVKRDESNAQEICGLLRKKKMYCSASDYLGFFNEREGNSYKILHKKIASVFFNFGLKPEIPYSNQI